MSDFAFPPGLLLILGAFVLPQLQGKARDVLTLALPLAVLAMVWSLPLGSHVTLDFLGYQLEPAQVTKTGRLFATVFSLMAFIGAIYAYKQARLLELCAAYVYAGSAICVTFAGDIISLFVFWELMAIGSTLVIWSAGTDAAYKASMRYLQVHLLGGVILFAGVVARVYATGSVEFTAMALSADFSGESLGNALILVGFLINAGAPPLSAWIADAYPEASPSGTVFLSAFTTKTAVYTLMVGFAGEQILIYIGVYMIFYGIIYALLENDMRRILAYSIVNQVGFMITAVGIGTELALNGAAAHAFAHIIYKALLLMSAGSVLYQTGVRKCSQLGGLFQTMPQTAITGMVGALAISAFPFTSGFVTKSLETSAAAYEGHVVVWFCMVAASAGVFLHAGIKFPWFVFFQKDSGLRPPEAPLNMRIALWVFAFLCVAIGIYPDPLYAILPYELDYEPYTADHLITQFQLLLFAGFAFFALLPLMRRTLTISLDFDWVYRKVLFGLGRWGSTKFWRIDQLLRVWILARIQSTMVFLSQFAPVGILSRSHPSSSMVLWTVAVLAIYLVFSFI
ncbi:MAG: Na(+)/H(+) antiporter subunit D [Alteromonadaceae bacterium]|nr:MAG: Na(+)/H(+) antiporter subunit D [Alteromonadaceae bacterium]